MIEHHIEYDADIPHFRLRDQLIEIVQRAVGRVNGGVIRHVIAVIYLRRNIKRRQPDGVYAKRLQVIKTRRDAT
ncbi:Uncharacterised protein [Yokenella regensburgei]|nr:Uncharacterised protein [Yokenella regensburgei]